MPDYTEIETLKRSVSLADLVRSYGVQLQSRGRELVGLCPFHEESTPSFSLNPERNLFQCFGCGARGSAIDFLMQMESVDFPGALAMLRQRESQPESGPAAPRKNVLLEAEHQKLARLVMDRYCKSFAESAAAQSYLQKRGFSAASIGRFPVGYADGRLMEHLAPKETEEGARERQLLREIGLINAHGRELFTGRLVIGIENEEGILTQMCGRKIKPGSPRYLYLPQPFQHVFHPVASGKDRLFVVEGIFDALSLMECGVFEVVATLGTHGSTELLLRSLTEFKGQSIILAFDGDASGQRAMDTLEKKLVGHHVQRLSLPDGMDVNDFLCQNGPAALRELVAAFDVPRNGKHAMDILTTDPGIEASLEDDLLKCTLAERIYRAHGMRRISSAASMGLTMTLSYLDGYFTAKMDLCDDRDRERFIRRASEKLTLDKKVIEQDLDLIGRKIYQIQLGKQTAPLEQKVEMSAEREARARAFGESKDILERIVEHYEICGLVGESTNALLAYLIMVSRLLGRPLHGMIRSASAAGKTTLMQKTADFCAPEDLLFFMSISEQYLFYMEDLRRKFMVIVEDIGAEKARYALKILQSEGRLIKGTLMKDDSGRTSVFQPKTEGPVATLSAGTGLLETTDEEASRVLELAMDESRDQTERVLQYQREEATADSFERKRLIPDIIELHHDFQRLLRPLEVKNPYAPLLRIQAERQSARRDNMRLLGIIQVITLLRQMQRKMLHHPDGGAYIESTVEDVLDGVRLAAQYLGRSLDELPANTCDFLKMFYEYVQELAQHRKMEAKRIHLSRMDLVRRCGLSPSQTYRHLRRLLELEYVRPQRQPDGSYLYEMRWEGQGQEGGFFIQGMADLEELRRRLREYRSNGKEPNK